MDATALPSTSTSASALHTRWARWGIHLSVLLLILLGNYFVRAYLEDWPHQSYFKLSRAPVEVLRRQPWRVLLPIDAGGGQRWFATTSLLVVEVMNVTFTPKYTFLILNALVIISSFCTSWLVSRSRVFTYTFTLCLAFGTQLHYSFALSGTFVLYLQIIYMEICLLCLHRVFTTQSYRRWWRVGFVVSLAVLAIGFDTWYNLLAFLWVGSVLMWVYYRRCGNADALPAIRFVFIAATLIACIHLPIKLYTAEQHFSTGREDELLLTYHSKTLMVEDFVSNVFTYLYISLTNFLPGNLLSSNSAYRLGNDAIVAEQHGYHAEYSHLVPMHHLFFWYYYAGIAATVYCYFLIRSTVRALRDRSARQLHYSLILLGIAAGAGTHMLIKYRPYMSVPSLSYKCMPSILATSILISYFLWHLRSRIRWKWVSGLCIALTWITILYGGLTRPSFLSHLNKQVGLGTYPDPAMNLRNMLSPHHHDAAANMP